LPRNEGARRHRIKKKNSAQGEKKRISNVTALWGG